MITTTTTGLCYLIGAVVAGCVTSRDVEAVDVDVVIVGAGYAGLAAASRLEQQNFSVHVLEAAPHVGGRTRNYDLGTGDFDTASDSVVEVGGTFVAEGHTALIELAQATGHQIYNVSGHGNQQRPLGGRERGCRDGLAERRRRRCCRRAWRRARRRSARRRRGVLEGGGHGGEQVGVARGL